MEKEIHFMNEKGEWRIQNLELDELLKMIIEGKVKEIDITSFSPDEVEQIKKFIKEKNLNFSIEQRSLLELVKKSFLRIVR